MGYTHYIRKPRELDKQRFSKFIEDFRKCMPLISEYCTIVGLDGIKPDPEITEEILAFNGPQNCGHAKNENVMIPWPDKKAQGVKFDNAQEPTGSWFGGAVLSTRVCNGDCSYESFVLQRKISPDSWKRPDKDGRYFDCCKTAFRPYDVAVTAALLLCKLHFQEHISVRTDGEISQWLDAEMIVRKLINPCLKVRVSEGDVFCSIMPKEVSSK